MTRFITLKELFDCQVIDINSFDGIVEVITDLQDFLLLKKVTILTPLLKKNVRSVLGLHVVHLLDKLVAHFAAQKQRVRQAHLLRLLNGLLIHNVLDFLLFEELLVSLIFSRCFHIILLKCILFRKQGRLLINFELFVLFLPVLLVGHNIVLVFL